LSTPDDKRCIDELRNSCCISADCAVVNRNVRLQKLLIFDN